MRGAILIRLCVCLFMIVGFIAGCSQMPRHSNTLVFATDTTVGLKVGQSSSQLGTVEVGYSRQEVALVPLLANTEIGSDKDILNPCPTSAVKDCKFVATSKGADKDVDSYSTIASFGSKVGTDGGANAKVAVAQYFATGVAAQLLVLSGGANIVQAGGDQTGNAAAAKAVAELQLAKERENAKEVLGSIELGKIAAKAMLSADGNAVTDAMVKKLSDAMGGKAGCTKNDLDNFNRSSVEAFTKEIETARSECLDRLGQQYK